MRSRCPRVHVRLDLEHEARERELPGGSTSRWSSSRAAAAAAHGRRKPPSSSSTPKLLIAEPKNTGVWRAGAVELGVESRA